MAQHLIIKLKIEELSFHFITWWEAIKQTNQQTKYVNCVAS